MNNRVLIATGATIGAFFLFKLLKSMNSTVKKTWDPGTDAKIARLHPKIRAAAAKAVNDLFEQGIKVKIISGLRTFEEQTALYAKGRTAPGNIVTKAKAGQSYHNYGLAIDVSYPATKRFEVVNAFEKNGFFWGGSFANFPDPPHFENRFGKTWSEFLKSAKYYPGTTYPII